MGYQCGPYLAASFHVAIRPAIDASSPRIPRINAWSDWPRRRERCGDVCAEDAVERSVGGGESEEARIGDGRADRWEEMKRVHQRIGGERQSDAYNSAGKDGADTF